MSTTLFTLTTLADTVGHWRFRNNLNDAANTQYTRTLPTLFDTIGHWKFQDSLVDISTKLNTFTGTGITSGDYTLGYTEKNNTALEVLSTNVATIAAANATDFDMGKANFTIELIVKVPTSAGTDSTGLNKYSSAGGWKVSYIGTGATWRLEFTDGTTSITSDASANLNDNTWHYIVWVVDRPLNIITNYVDGILNNSVSIPTALNSIDNSIIDLTLQTTVANILWDEICITRSKLSTTDIKSRYSGSASQGSGGNLLTAAGGFTSSDFITGYTEDNITAAQFDGTKYVNIPAGNSSFEFDPFYTSFTIESIFKTTQAVDFPTIVAKGTTATTSGWSINSTALGVSKITLGDGGFSTFTTEGITTINDGNWHYLAVVVDRDASTLNTYIDGVVDISSVDISSNISGSIRNTSEPFVIGQTMNGDIDEICITKRALSANEIVVRQLGHGDPFIFNTSGSASITTNVVTSNLTAFDLKLKHTCDHILASGAFTLETCPRCNGTGFFFDIQFDKTGHPTILKIEDKLIQSLEKLVLTTENNFHADIILGIHDKIGNQLSDMIGIIKYGLINGVATMKQNQRGVPNLSPRAQIATLDSIVVDKDTPTSLRYLVEITTLSGETAELTGSIILPN